jgi:hypothetical protein
MARIGKGAEPNAREMARSLGADVAKQVRDDALYASIWLPMARRCSLGTSPQ